MENIEIEWECSNGHLNKTVVEFRPGMTFDLRCSSCREGTHMRWEREKKPVTFDGGLGIVHDLRVLTPDHVEKKQVAIGSSLSWSITDTNGNTVSGGSQ